VSVIAKIMLYKRNIFLWNKRESMINEATQNNSESIILENLNHFSFKKGGYFYFFSVETPEVVTTVDKRSVTQFQ
jgi:hypothetical protein